VGANLRQRSLKESIISLAFVQGADYLVPLLAIPYLLRVLGSEGYGKIAFVQAFCAYFVMLAEFGFGWTGTRRIAVERDNRTLRSGTFWAVQSVKLSMALVSFVIAGVLVATVPQLRALSTLFLLGMLPVIGAVMYPLWFLQGLEQMREAAGIMLCVRFALLAGVFLMVDTPEDLNVAAALQMGSTPLAGILACWYLARTRAVDWVRPGFDGMQRQFSEGWHAFLAAASSTIYRSGNAVVLGLVVGTVPVAYYSIAEKLVKAVQELSRPIAQATFPRVSAYVVESREEAIRLLRKLLLSIGGFCLCLSIALYIFAPQIIHVVAGKGFDEAIPIMRLMAIIPFIGGMNSVLGVQTMHPFGFAREFSYFVGLAGIANILLIVPLVFWFSAKGAAVSYLVSELVLLISLILFHRHKGIHLVSSPRKD